MTLLLLFSLALTTTTAMTELECLPPSLIDLILRHLSFKELITASTVCKTLRRHIRSQSGVWKSRSDYPSYLTDEFFTKWLQGQSLLHLQTLTLPIHNNVTDNLFRFIAQHCEVSKSLVAVDTSTLPSKHITESSLRCIAAAAGTCLRRLSFTLPLANTTATDDGLADALASCTSLSALDFSYTVPVSARTLKAIEAFGDRMDALVLRGCVNIPASALISVIPTLTNLAVLNLWGLKNVTNDVLLAIGTSLRHLVALDVGSPIACKFNDQGFVAMLASFPQPSRLSSLNISGCGVTHVSVSAMVKKLPALEKAHLSFIEHIDAGSVSQLLDCGALKELYLLSMPKGFGALTVELYTDRGIRVFHSLAN
jgi:hypothetical protein